MAEIRCLGLGGVMEIVPRRFGDDRGFFSETYNRNALAEAGIRLDFVQDNQSYSAEPGVLRGLHYQLAPRQQAKLVRVTRGRVFDVAVDVRPGSTTFGKWVGVELSAERWNQLYVPPGFAHGFLTLEPGTEVIYKVSDFYAPEHERAIRYDDPDLAIDWPLPVPLPILSAKDASASRLKHAELPEMSQGVGR